MAIPNFHLISYLIPKIQYSVLKKYKMIDCQETKHFQIHVYMYFLYYLQLLDHFPRDSRVVQNHSVYKSESASDNLQIVFSTNDKRPILVSYNSIRQREDYRELRGISFVLVLTIFKIATRFIVIFLKLLAEVTGFTGLLCYRVGKSFDSSCARLCQSNTSLSMSFRNRFHSLV